MMLANAQNSRQRLLRWLHGLEWTDLAFAFERGPMDPVQVHESRGQRHGVIIGLCLDERIPADHLFGLDEGAVEYGECTARETDALSLCRGLQPRRVDDRAVLHRRADKLTHRIE